jgi:hypothetical protein
MIMTHEQAFLKARTQFAQLLATVQTAGKEQLRLDQVERDLFAQLLALGHSLLSGFVAQAGTGDVGTTTSDPRGQRWQRLPETHARPYRSLFGLIPLVRYVYGTREGQKIEWVPLDATLGVPAGEFSYVLEDWAQRLCLQGAFAEGAGSLADLLNLHVSVRSLEHMNQVVAASVPSFADQRPLPPAQEEGELLVLTADGKGVPMRRLASDEPVAADEASPWPRPARRGRRRCADEAPGRTRPRAPKQMAYVGAIYTIDRFVRTADDVVDEVLRRQRAADRPRPVQKHVWAEMTTVVEGETCNGRATLFDQLAHEWARRDPRSQRPAICLLDGERALWEMYALFWEGAIGILDLFHVLQRLWKVAACVHGAETPAAEGFVTAQLRTLLEGKVDTVIRRLGQLPRVHGLRGKQRQMVREVQGYFRNNRAHMRYDEYLAAGYPIGSGVAEGACRHLVKDRLEQTGMRWVLEGAQAMLHVRATYLNGEWSDFIAYRIRVEQQRLYGTRDAEPDFTLAS